MNATLLTAAMIFGQTTPANVPASRLELTAVAEITLAKLRLEQSAKQTPANPAQPAGNLYKCPCGVAGGYCTCNAGKHCSGPNCPYSDAPAVVATPVMVKTTVMQSVIVGNRWRTWKEMRPVEVMVPAGDVPASAAGATVNCPNGRCPAPR